MTVAHVALSLLFLVAPLRAHAAPGADLIGKSVLVTWTENRQQRTNGSEVRPVTRSFQLQLYISGAGRPFTRVTSGGAGGPLGNEQVGGSGESLGRGNRAVRINGNSVVVQANSANYARNLQIKVAPGGGGCTAMMSVGKEPGSAPMAFRNVAGTTIEIHSLGVSGVSCSIRPGNVFGG